MAEYVVVDKEQLEADLTTVADSLRAKSGTTEVLAFPLGMKEVVESIDTSKEEQEKTIEITENGTTEVTPDEGKVLSKVTVNTNVESGGGSGASDKVLDIWVGQANCLFAGVTFPEDKEIILRLNGSSFTGSKTTLNLVYAFQCGGLRKVKVCVDLISTARCEAYGMFAYPSILSIETVDFSEFIAKPVNVGSFFANQKKLKEVLGILDWSLANGDIYIFMNCNALEYIRFLENSLKLSLSFKDSPLLSSESIQSIINGLATVETAKTITLHADVKAKLTDEQLTTITNKNWTLA